MGKQQRRGSCGSRFKYQRRRIDAIALPRGRGAVSKHVAQMRTAPSTDGFGARHAVRAVDALLDRAGHSRLPKAWPAATRVELGFRRKQPGAAANAMITAASPVLHILAGKRPFGSGPARNLERARLGTVSRLLGGQIGTPLVVGSIINFGHGAWSWTNQISRVQQVEPIGSSGKSSAFIAPRSWPAMTQRILPSCCFRGRAWFLLFRF